MVQYAGRRIYPLLLDAGVRVWEHERDILHAKFFVADEERTIIGSYNADRWGQRYNQEVAAQIDGRELADGLAVCFRKGATVEITRETIDAWPWYVMFFAHVLWLLSKILAPDASHRARRKSRTAPLEEGQRTEDEVHKAEGTEPALSGTKGQRTVSSKQ